MEHAHEQAAGDNIGLPSCRRAPERRYALYQASRTAQTLVRPAPMHIITDPCVEPGTVGCAPPKVQLSTGRADFAWPSQEVLPLGSQGCAGDAPNLTRGEVSEEALPTTGQARRDRLRGFLAALGRDRCILQRVTPSERRWRNYCWLTVPRTELKCRGSCNLRRRPARLYH
jgi:hypothetical protein